MALSERSKTAVTATPDFPTTKYDMEEMYKWEHGDEVKGTFAKSRPAWKRYRDDINKAYGNEDKNKDLYIDTLSKTSVVEQMKRWSK